MDIATETRDRAIPPSVINKVFEHCGAPKLVNGLLVGAVQDRRGKLTGEIVVLDTQEGKFPFRKIDIHHGDVIEVTEYDTTLNGADVIPRMRVATNYNQVGRSEAVNLLTTRFADSGEIEHYEGTMINLDPRETPVEVAGLTAQLKARLMGEGELSPNDVFNTRMLTTIQAVRQAFGPALVAAASYIETLPKEEQVELTGTRQGLAL